MRKKFTIILCVIASLFTLVSCSGQPPNSSIGGLGSDSTTECLHSYDNACDEDCNECGELRITEHRYDGVCDIKCNECGGQRVVDEGHTYKDACDADCDICGEKRIPSEHKYDDEYDEQCNECGKEREAPQDPVNGGNWTGEAPLK